MRLLNNATGEEICKSDPTYGTGPRGTGFDTSEKLLVRSHAWHPVLLPACTEKRPACTDSHALPLQPGLAGMLTAVHEWLASLLKSGYAVLLGCWLVLEQACKCCPDTRAQLLGWAQLSQL